MADGISWDSKGSREDKDVILVATDGEVKINKLLLKTRCPGLWEKYDDQSNKLSVTDYDTEMVQAFVDYLTTGTTGTTIGDAMKLCKMATLFVANEDLKKIVILQSVVIDYWDRIRQENLRLMEEVIREYPMSTSMSDADEWNSI